MLSAGGVNGDGNSRDGSDQLLIAELAADVAMQDAANQSLIRHSQPQRPDAQGL